MAMDIRLDVKIDGNSIRIKNITSEEIPRSEYALCIFWSIDDFASDINMNISEPFGTDYLFVVPAKGKYTVDVYCIPVFDAEISYDVKDMVYTNVEVTGKMELVTKYYAANEDRPGTIPSSKWDEVGTQVVIADIYNYFAESNNTTLIRNYIEVASSQFLIKKTEENTYMVTVPEGVLAYNVDVFTFEEYINNKEASLSFDENNTISETFVLTDGIYVVAITEGENDIKYHVLYNFDSLRKVMKALLIRIFCNTHEPDCPIDLAKQRESDRLFITSVSVAMGTMLGMIHSEQVDHYHYFSFNESRLSALQRANDIMQKTLLMYADYNYELPCHCHNTNTFCNG